MNLGVAEPEEDETILNVDNCEDIMVEVTMDSSACRHVMAREDAPGYQVHDSASSGRGRGFLVENGERVPNERQSILNLEADNGREATAQLASTFHVADLTKPLVSVSQIREQGFRCVLEGPQSLVINSSVETVCRFDRSGQLYTAKMILKTPEPCPRPS